MVYFIIGVLVYVLLNVFCYKLGKKRNDRALNKTDYGKVWNFLCDLANSCLGVSPCLSFKIGRWVDEDGAKNE